MKNKLLSNNKGSASLMIIMILVSMLLILLLYVNFETFKQDTDVLKLRQAYIQADLGIDEGIYIFNNKKENFYKKLNGCERLNGGIPIVYETNSSSYNNDYGKINTNINYNGNILINNTFPNGRGYLNRICTIYQDSYPYEGNEDFIIDSSDITIDGINPKNESYFIKITDRESNKGFIFSKDTLLNGEGQENTETSLKFILAYNILSPEQLNKFGGFDYLSSSKKYKDIVNLLKSKQIEVNKENIMKYFSKDLSSVTNNAKVEIGLVEYDGNYSEYSKSFEVNTSNKPKVIERKICEENEKKCILDLNGPNILKNNKIYFFYYKTFDKATTTSFQIQDQLGNSINFITGDLKIDTYGNSDKLLVKKTYVKENVINNDLSSAIFNYLYYSQN